MAIFILDECPHCGQQFSWDDDWREEHFKGCHGLTELALKIAEELKKDE